MANEAQGIYAPSVFWEAPEYIYRPKGPEWYTIAGILTISIAVGAFVLSNVLFGILVLIGGFTIALMGARKPEVLRYEINKQGIMAGQQLYMHRDLKSFWILDYDHEPRLLLASTKVFMPQIIIPIGEADPEVVRDVLLAYLAEEEQRDSVTQGLMDRLGF